MKKKLFAGLVAAIALIGCTAASATTLSSSVNVDNSFNLYISTNDTQLGTWVGSGGDWTITYGFNSALTNGVTNYIHLVAANVGGPGGFEGKFTLSDTGFVFANSTQKLLTETTSWVYRWNSFADASNTPVSEGNNGVGPWGSMNYGGDTPQWLWNYNSTSGDDHNVLYFSAAIYSTAPPVPEPASLALLGLGLAGLVGTRRLRVF